MDRAELIIALSGDRQALSSLQSLQTAMKNLNNSRANLRIEKSAVDRSIADVQAQIRKLTQQKNEIRFMGGNTDEIEAKILVLRDRLRDLTDRRNEIRLEISDLQLGISGLRDVRHELEDANRAAVDFVNTLGDVFNNLSGVSGTTADFASGIGNAFLQMGDLFSSSITDTITKSLTFLATKTLVGDFGRIVSRYDIMSTFTRYMEAAGVQAEESAAALQKVNDAILGLPIGLDEAAYRLRRYQMFLGNTTDATNLTVGLQNAILAGGASEQMRNTTYQQIDRLLAAGRLNTSRQWIALMQGLGVSVRYVAEEMGVAGMKAGDLAAGLYSGEISAEEFLRALMSLGEGTSDAAKGLQNLLDVYRGTIQSWLENIQFAAVRGGETILKSLESAFTANTGRGIVGYLREIRDAMNDMFAGTGQFITGNPQLITRMLTSLEGLFATISRFSASRAGEDVFTNLTRLVDMLSRALAQLPVEETEEFIAFATTLAGPIGKVFTAVSSGLGTLLGVFQRFKNFNFERLLDRIIREVGRLADAVYGVLSLIPDGLMADLLAFGLVWGRPVADVLGMIGTALAGVAGAINAANTGVAMAGGGGLIAQIMALGPSAPALFGVAAAIGALALALGKYAQARAQQTRRLEDELGLDSIYELTRASDALVQSSESMAASLDANIGRAEARLEVARGLVQEVMGLQTSPTDEAGLARLRADVTQLNQLFPTLNLELDEATGKLSAVGVEALHTAETFVALATEAAKAQHVIEAIGGLESANLDLEVERKMLEDEITRAEEKIAELEGRTRRLPFYYDDPSALDIERLEDAERFLNKLFPDDSARALELEQEAYAALKESLAAVDEQIGTNTQRMEAYREVLNGINEAAESLGQTLNSDTLMNANRLGMESFEEGLLQGGHGTIKAEIKDALVNRAQQIIDEYVESTKTAAEEADTSEVGEKVVENTVKSIEDAAKKADTTPVADAVVKSVEETIDDAMGNAGYEFDAEGMVGKIADQINGADWTPVKEALARNLTLENYGIVPASFNLTGGLTAREQNGYAADRYREESEGYGDIYKVPGAELNDYLRNQDDLLQRFGTQTGGVSDLLSKLSELSTAVELFTTRGIPDLLSALEGANDQFTRVSDVGVRNLYSAFENLGNLTVIGIISMFGDLTKTLTDLNAAFEAVDLTEFTEYLSGDFAEAMATFRDAENVEAFAALAEALGAALEAVNMLIGEDDTGLVSLESWMTTIAYEAVPDLDVSLREELYTALGLAKTQTDNLTNAMEKLTQALDDARNAARQAESQMDSLSGSIAGVAADADAAAAAVAALADAIAGLEGKEIALGVETAGTAQGTTGSRGPRALPFSNGGPVYLARGGVFKPRGTDTVPAMLTPGEFVMNRSAVKAFGLDFMKRINSIDFGAAVQAMYRRMPTMASFVPFYNVQNRNDNRNITVNQNIYDSGERYSYRIANRWAHAL